MNSKLSVPTYTIDDLTSAVMNKDMPLVKKIISSNKQLVNKEDEVFYISLKIFHIIISI